MLKAISLIWLILLVYTSLAQSTSKMKSQNSKQSILAVHFIANDFATAEYVRLHSLHHISNNWAKLKDMNYGLSIQYLQNLTNHLDFSGRVDASFTNYLFRNRMLQSQKGLLIEADAGLNCKLLSDDHIVNPFLHAGISGSVYERYFGMYLPLGIGLQFNVNKGDVFIFSNAQYRLRLNANAENHFNYSIGVGGLLTKHKKEKHQERHQLLIVIDTDGDGIDDNKDSCKTVPGIAKYKGCPIPDSDGDGINDELDKCPTQPGLATYMGCPIPDTDGDGINDELDSCPQQPGIAKYKGCPIPDSDGDGVNDEIDECPAEAGPASNHGCPERKQVSQNTIDTIAHQIFFATGSATLLSQSYLPLDKLVALLKGNVDLGMDIEGHTDTTGSDAINIDLSQHRAEAVLNYLIKNGINKNRLTAKGYGSSLPVASNSTDEGRALNRRVELKLKKM